MYPKIKKLLNGKNILILGLGKEGRSTLNFIKNHIDYKALTVADKNIVSDDIPSGVNCLFGEHYMDTLNTYDVIIKSPGIVYKNVDISVINKTVSQTTLFLLEFAGATIGITGTKGKSTTTTLIYHILKENSVNAVLAGNIGIPPLDAIASMSKSSVAVFEMSCHQLEFEKISPHISVILNLYEDHLDHYGNRDKYIKAKENIYLHQSENDYFIVNSSCTEQINKAVSKVLTVGTLPKADYYIAGAKINEEYTIPSGISLIGTHNHYNIAVAYAVCQLFGIKDKGFSSAVKTYNTLPHRLELFATKNGVQYFDDSISTVPETTIQAIKSIKNLKTVIIGGMDRGIDYTPLIDFFVESPTENIILLPDTGHRIGEELKKNGISFEFANNLEEAVSIASKVTTSGSACVLSPAAASYGFFRNFEERGDKFKELVNKL